MKSVILDSTGSAVTNNTGVDWWIVAIIFLGGITILWLLRLALPKYDKKGYHPGHLTVWKGVLYGCLYCAIVALLLIIRANTDNIAHLFKKEEKTENTEKQSEDEEVLGKKAAASATNPMILITCSGTIYKGLQRGVSYAIPDTLDKIDIEVIITDVGIRRYGPKSGKKIVGITKVHPYEWFETRDMRLLREPCQNDTLRILLTADTVDWTQNIRK